MANARGCGQMCSAGEEGEVAHAAACHHQPGEMCFEPVCLGKTNKAALRKRGGVVRSEEKDNGEGIENGAG